MAGEAGIGEGATPYALVAQLRLRLTQAHHSTGDRSAALDVLRTTVEEAEARGAGLVTAQARHSRTAPA